MIKRIREWLAGHTIFAIFVGAVVVLFILGLAAWRISACIEKKKAHDAIVADYAHKIQDTEENTITVIEGKDHNIQTNIGNNLWGE